jgi:3,5-dioxohexanoate:acetyl-CoA acetone transferase
MSPHLPVTPDEIATASVEAVEAGAAIVHLHARNPETGRPGPRPELFLDFMPKIKDACDAVLNVSTGGGLGMTREERLRAAVAWR